MLVAHPVAVRLFADAYAQASSTAAAQLHDFEPRCNRPGLFALDEI